MHKRWILFASLIPNLAAAQFGVYAFVPSQNAFLKLKSAEVQSTVIGSIVRTSTDFIYERSPASVSGVSFNFELPASSTLGGFGYFVNDKFIAGRLQLREPLSAIESESGSGLRRTAILEKTWPSVYRCELRPATQDKELRIRVWTDGMVQHDGHQLSLPKPSIEVPVQPNSPSWTLRNLSGLRITPEASGYVSSRAEPMAAVSQKFLDGRYYVAGYLHLPHAQIPRLEVEHAYYEPLDGRGAGKDVTKIVDAMVRGRQFLIWASDAVFGDPLVNVAKRLRVVAKIDGKECTISVPENETMNLLGRGGGSLPPQISGLHDLRVVVENPQMVTFFGWSVHTGSVSAVIGGRRFRTCATVIPRGSDAARLWAQQSIATVTAKGPEKGVDFSLKYGVLGPETAFLVVTAAEPVTRVPAP